jgi:UDP-N-acetylmuramoylalanine--D-glutamate ligase
MILTDKKVLVVGLARSGMAAARFAARRGARVTVTDQSDASKLAAAIDRLDGGAALELGGPRRESFTGADLNV